ncbi:hypothetical protein HN958_03895 [Candidatus Falkowbacteria bacterium]|jgi:chromosome segregation ATPase|nr:hypothetical protein [Candidatus Falkowbacteria bacterium]MBT7913779.1 hypothetical protein [Candidatus Bathyarchaeota archaeon]
MKYFIALLIVLSGIVGVWIFFSNPAQKPELADEVKVALADGIVTDEEQERIKEADAKLRRRIVELEEKLRDMSDSSEALEQLQVKYSDLEREVVPLREEIEKARRMIASHASGLSGAAGPSDLEELKRQAARAGKLVIQLGESQTEVTRLSRRVRELEELLEDAVEGRDLAEAEQRRLESDNERLQRKLRGPSIADMLEKQRTRPRQRSQPRTRSVLHGPTLEDLGQTYLDNHREQQRLCAMERQLGRSCSR